MRDTLQEVIRNTVSKIELLQVVGTPTSTQFIGQDKDRFLFIKAELDVPIAEFQGTFGLRNLPLLKGLLNFPAYQAPNATITTKTRLLDNQTTVEQIEFRDEYGIGSDYRCVSPNVLPKQTTINPPTWDVEFTPTPDKFAEFGQLASIFSGGELKQTQFGLKTEKNNLVISFGDSHAITHRGAFSFGVAIKGDIKTTTYFENADFLSVIKLAGSRPVTFAVSTGKGMCLTIPTNVGSFSYFLRAQTQK